MEIEDFYDEIPDDDDAVDEARRERLKDAGKREAVRLLVEIMKTADAEEIDGDDLYETVLDCMQGLAEHQAAKAEYARQTELKKQAAKPVSAAEIIFEQAKAINAVYVAGMAAGRGR